MDPKSWLKYFSIIVLILIMVLSMATYIIDPLYYYDYEASTKIINPRFSNAGLIKNYEYDTVIIGSSMVQNFNMDSFRDKMNLYPLKVTAGGLTTKEQISLYEMIEQEGKASTFIMSIDIHTMAKEGADNVAQKKFPSYLYNDTAFDDYNYLIGYEVWMRFLPVNLAFWMIDKANVTMSDNLEYYIDVDKIGDWSNDYSYSEEVVKEKYLSKIDATTSLMIPQIEDNISYNIEILAQSIVLESDKQYIFFFPPYSALFWFKAKEEDYFDLLMNGKKEFIQRFSGYENIRIIDMQDCCEIIDLDNYRDATHYNPVIQESIIDKIVDGSCDVKEENMDVKIEELEILIQEFEACNEWLQKNR